MISTPVSSNKTFHILTFGCQMNVRDSQWLASALKSRGFIEAPLEQAAFILLNTCSVREKPEQKVVNSIHSLEQKAPQARIAVLGCVSQQLGGELFAESPKICLVAGPDNLNQSVETLNLIAEGRSGQRELLAFSREYEEKENVEEDFSGPSAFINIMQGCDNFCSYCIVPFTRGRQKFRSATAILQECEKRLEQGAIELTLLGQNVNVWRDDDKNFPWLLRKIAKISGLERLRFVTPHPKDLDAQTIACFGELPVLCPSLHLPLQAGSNKILKAMRRRYTKEEYLALLEALRSARADIVFSTDLIVGFPGETEQDFEETLAMVKECGFVSSYSFCYSDRPGAAASFLPNKIDTQTKLERLQRLQALQDEQTRTWLKSRLGSCVKVIFESPSPRGPASSWQGRDIYGSCVHAHLPNVLAPKGFVAQVHIIESKKHCLMGELAS